MPNLNLSSTLLTAAEAYFYLGYSVIPLLGDLDPARPKVPAIPWAGFQQYRASLDDYRQWFTEIGSGGLGIVTGRISQLVILDFDSEVLFTDFSVQYPDLTETHTVRSAGRQLPHLYFHLPPHLRFPSQKGQGIDLLSDGCYVVAPPTSINGQPYKITRGGMPKTLTERDIRRTQAFLNAHKNVPTPTAPKIQTQATLKPPVQVKAAHKPSDCELHALYQYWTQNSGRNEALFRTSLYARNTGWLLEDAMLLLKPLHSRQTTGQLHEKETLAQRQHEATRTVQSAFSRPARPIKSQTTRRQGILPNSVREALMQRKMTYVVRTLEGLRNAGVHPGQQFTANKGIDQLKGVVGRDSVLKALQAGEDNLKFFSPPVPPPITANAVATDNSKAVSKECSFEGSKNQYKIKKGRPEHIYRMPTNDELCAILGIKTSYSDPLEPDDLFSAKKTRMALHRELIKRRPAQYGKNWLARRLGVNKRTLATYNRLIPIHSRAIFTETPINWKTIELLPFDEPIQGAVLVTHGGKRYPALRTIASRLLANGESLCLKQQTANYYWYGDEEPPMAKPIGVIEKQPQQEALKATLTQQNANFLPPELFWSGDSEPPQSISKQSRAVKTPHHNFHKPLTDKSQEALAQYIYTAINQLSGENRKTISLANARRITLMQSENHVRAALNLIQQRKTVTNPTGFLITMLRSKYE